MVYWKILKIQVIFAEGCHICIEKWKRYSICSSYRYYRCNLSILMVLSTFLTKFLLGPPLKKDSRKYALKWTKMGFLKFVPNFDSALIPDIFVKKWYPNFDTLNIYQNRVKNDSFEYIALGRLNLHNFFLLWRPPQILLLHSAKMEY